MKRNTTRIEKAKAAAAAISTATKIVTNAATKAADDTPRILLAIPTYICYDKLSACLNSVFAGTCIPDEVIIYNHGAQEIESPHPITVIKRKNNIAGAWNDAMSRNVPITIICNDDIIFEPNAIEAIARQVNPSSQSFYTILTGEDKCSCFILTQSMYQLIGKFDENYSPAYFEDIDYLYRMRRLGKDVTPIQVAISHAKSSTFEHRADKQNHHTSFLQNQSYYRDKWGGLPGAEMIRTLIPHP